MKIDEIKLEHTRISNCIFNDDVFAQEPDEDIGVTETDEAYNRREILEVFRPLLYERSVIDECCERFRKTF